MDFILLTLGGLAVMVGLLLLVARLYPGSGADILDWKPTRDYETEVQLELDDVEQMIEAQNERRRASGRPEITEEQVRAKVAEEQRELEEWRQRSMARQNPDGEDEDLAEMLELHNASRRAKGLPDVSAEEFRRSVEQ